MGLFLGKINLMITCINSLGLNLTKHSLEDSERLRKGRIRSMTMYVYTPQFLELRKIVNRVDPIGLIEIDCPDDEYDPEVNDIL